MNQSNLGETSVVRPAAGSWGGRGAYDLGKVGGAMEGESPNLV